jgi:hypothetical protein
MASFFSTFRACELIRGEAREATYSGSFNLCAYMSGVCTHNFATRESSEHVKKTHIRSHDRAIAAECEGTRSSSGEKELFV